MIDMSRFDETIRMNRPFIRIETDGCSIKVEQQLGSMEVRDYKGDIRIDRVPPHPIFMDFARFADRMNRKYKFGCGNAVLKPIGSVQQGECAK